MSKKYTVIGPCEDGLQIFWHATEQVRVIPAPRFKHRQFVQTSVKHYSPKPFTQVIEPSWTGARGWVYGERFIDEDGTGGGSGYWNEEALYEELSEPRLLLIARRLTLQENIKEHETMVERDQHELAKIDHCLNLIDQLVEPDPED